MISPFFVAQIRLWPNLHEPGAWCLWSRCHEEGSQSELRIQDGWKPFAEHIQLAGASPCFCMPSHAFGSCKALCAATQDMWEKEVNPAEEERAKVKAGLKHSKKKRVGRCVLGFLTAGKAMFPFSIRLDVCFSPTNFVGCEQINVNRYTYMNMKVYRMHMCTCVCIYVPGRGPPPPPPPNPPPPVGVGGGGWWGGGVVGWLGCGSELV